MINSRADGGIEGRVGFVSNTLTKSRRILSNNAIMGNI